MEPRGNSELLEKAEKCGIKLMSFVEVMDRVFFLN
jgi:hypothetical protein